MVPVVLALALVGAACRPTPAPRPHHPSHLRLALAPAHFPDALSLQQRVTVERDRQTVSFDAVLDITPDAVTLIAMGFGTRLFSLKYDGTRLDEQRSPMLPAEVQGADILSDLQLALWPAEAVRRALPEGWQLREAVRERILERAGEVVTTIHYGTDVAWRGDVVMENRPFAYRLLIRTVPTE